MMGVGDAVCWKAVNGEVVGVIVKDLGCEMYLVQTDKGTVIIHSSSFIDII